MEHAAYALAALGFLVGIIFRFKILLALIGLLLVVSIGFSLSHGFSFLGTFATVMAAQAILQGSYFVGLIAQAAFSAQRARVRKQLQRYGDESYTGSGVPRIVFSLLQFLTL